MVYSSKLEGRPLRCLLSDKVYFYMNYKIWSVGRIMKILLKLSIMLKANDKLYQWLEDDDAMEEAMGGECDLHFFSNYILVKKNV